jgi:hypothetical protein
MMNIKKWYYGKIILLWAWGVVLIAALLKMLETTEHFVFGFLLIALLFIIPIFLSIITWKWFSGKES